MTLNIHLLGQPRLLVDSTPLRFNAPPKTIPLLAYLLLHRQQVVERQQVAFTLWSDDPESTARANLRRHIHQLQRALPPAAPDRPWLVGDARTIGWNLQSDYWLDVAEFEHLSGSSDQLELAITGYTGDLLETHYEDWVFFERERLLNLYYTILTRQVSQLRARREFQAASSYAQLLLRRDPFREDILHQLMCLRYEAGDRAGAIQEYESFERQLRKEMGVTPMPETQAIHEIILRNGKLPGSAGAPGSETTVSEKSRSLPVLPFVGRVVEFTQVAARWSRAAHGLGGLVLVGGEAGVGKTRLTHELALLVESQGGRVLRGNTAPDEHTPYQALTEALQAALPLLVALEGQPAQLAALAALVPELKTRRKLPNLPALDPEKDRTRLFDAVATCLASLAEPRPLLVILEDLHWAGAASAALVEFLVRRAAGRPLLILGTYRDEETGRAHPLRQLHRRLKNEKLVEHLPLSRLARPAIDKLLAGLASELNLPALADERLAGQLYAESEGNALFIELLLQHWQASGQTALAELPGGVQAVITRRLGLLQEQSRNYAEMAAVLGTAFDAEAAREAGGWDEASAHQALNELLDNRLVRYAGAHSRFDYLFAHHLIQAALYDEIPPPKRKRCHLRTAQVLEELYPAQRKQIAGELAAHYDRADRPEQAIPLYFEAVQNRLAVFADSEAQAAIERALTLASTAPAAASPRLLLDLWSVREGIHSRRGERVEQFEALQRMEQVAAGNPEWLCEVLYRRILYHRNKDEHQTQLQLIEALKTQAQAVGHPRWLAQAVYAEGNYLKIIDDYAAAAARLEAALGLFEALNDSKNQVLCCCHLAELYIIQRQSAAAEAWAQRALKLCALDEPTPQLLSTLWNLSANGLIHKDLERCLHYGQRLLAAAESASDRVWQAAAHRLIGMAYQRQFRIGEARRSLEAALALYRLSQKPKGEALTLQVLGHIEIALGNHAAASAFYQQAYGIESGLNDYNGMASELINLGFVAASRADYPAVLEYAEQSLEFARRIANEHLEAVSLQNLGEAHRELGDLPAAAHNLRIALALLEDPTLIHERTSVLADLALTCWYSGDLSEAVALAEQILANYPQIAGGDDNQQRYLWAAARVLLAAGQPERAGQCLTLAYQCFTQELAVIPDSDSRQAYLQLKHNRQIKAAFERGEWV